MLGGAAGRGRSRRGQQPAMLVIGFLNTASPGPSTPRVRAFHRRAACRAIRVPSMNPTASIGTCTPRKPANLADRMNIPRRDHITLLGSVVSAVLCVSAAVQEGYYRVGHDKWHSTRNSKETTAKARAAI
jgi:hypothetical protein